MKLSNYSIKHPVVITIILVSSVLFGFISLMSMRQDLLPNLSMPGAVIFSIYPGAGPFDVEREVTDVLEREFSTINGVSSITSESVDSVSIINIEFDWNQDVDEKINEISRAITNAEMDMPDNMQGKPLIFKMSTSNLPIFTTTVESMMDNDRLTDFVNDNVIPRLNRISGIASARILGGNNKIVRINLDMEKMASREIDVLDVYQLVKYNNAAFPAGKVVFRGKKLSFRTVGEFSTLDEIRNLVVGMKADEGAFILMKDVADVYFDNADPDHYADFGGKPVLALEVNKQADGDSMNVIEEVKKVFSDVEHQTSGKVQFNPIVDFSKDIQLSISTVKNSALLGAVLAVLIIFLFLHNFRTTFIVGISIPLSVVLSFIMMKAAGLNINLMTLAGLTVAIGMMVDSSIVILENTNRKFKAGLNRKDAAREGAGEVGTAVIASAATSLAVFVPIMFLSGLTGIILKDVSATIVFALISSLVVSVIVVPYLSALILKHEKKSDFFLMRIKQKSERGLDAGLVKLENFYRKVLKASLNNRMFVVLLACSVLILSFLAVEFLGFEFFSAPDMNEFEITAKMPAGYTLDQSRYKMQQVSDFIQENVPEVESGVFFTGLDGNFSISTSTAVGYARLRLVRKTERERSIFDIIKFLQQNIPSSIGDIDIEVSNGGLAKMLTYATGGEGFIIELYGKNFDDVLEASKVVKGLMEQDPEIYKSVISINSARRELVSTLNPEYLGYSGLTSYETGVVSNIVFHGLDVGAFREDGSARDIFLTSDLAGSEITAATLNKVKLKTRSEEFIPLSNVSEVKLRKSVDKVPHKDRVKSILVTGMMETGNVRYIQERLTSKLKDIAFPLGVEWQIGGSAELMADAFKSLLSILIISIFLVYAVMVIQFERFSQPLIVMASIPFTAIGVISALMVFGSSLSIMGLLGIIALAGMVVNNAIVLIDYINILRDRDGMELMPAVIEGCSARLTPILMTTLTTILGVIPMAMGLGEGAELYGPLGQAIGGGLITSTMITLFLIPVLYFSLEKFKINRKRKRDEIRGTL